MRLPPRPDLHWKEDGTPVDERVGDVYYSVDDGLAETRTVFLKGCGLPEAWQGRGGFTVAELGFGTGLNFLALWQMWRETRGAQGWLHFVSFEGFPLDREDAEQALQPWPELAELAAKLCARWPVRAKGVQQIVWPEERLTLTLHMGMIEDTLPQSEFLADAWFLDGFSPAKNEAMWGEALWPFIAKRSAPGARVGTFTVAGAVRRGLEHAGFEVERVPGYGRKRQRLEATFQSELRVPIDFEPPKRIAIIGAGISGACLAYALKQRGLDPTIFDQAESLGAGASGNPLALVMPRLDAGDTVQARLLVDAYVAAQGFYRGLPGVERTEVLHRPRDEKEAARFAKVLADPPLGLEQLEALKEGGLLHKQAMILRPEMLLPALLKGMDVHWGRSADVDFEARAVNGEAFDAIVLAGGWQMGDALPQLDLTGRLGQVDWVQSTVDAPPSALAAGHYALASGEMRLWGATFEAMQGPPQVSQAAQETNAHALDQLAPYWRQEAGRFEVESRASARATTADRLPLIGGLPDDEMLIDMRAQLERQQWSVDLGFGECEGLYLAAGYGSRGFTWGPWAAEILTARLLGNPIPARAEALSVVTPSRQILRRLKRGLI